MRIGIVGHGEEKFTPKGKANAQRIIRDLLSGCASTVVSGHSPVGGVDIYAEDIGQELGLKLDIKTPRQHVWDGEYGYKKRNLDIAKDSDIIYVLLVDRYPDGYKGMKFNYCYHCKTDKHIKSGGCWTALQAQKLGKPIKWIIVEN